jgi:hypothetical protein
MHRPKKGLRFPLPRGGFRTVGVLVQLVAHGVGEPICVKSGVQGQQTGGINLDSGKPSLLDDRNLVTLCFRLTA